MGAVLMSEAVYTAIAEGAPDGQVIGHGLTYSGHPVSAAVGLEVLRLYTEGGILAHGQAMGWHFAAGLKSLVEHPLVGEARGRGLLGALELVADKKRRTAFNTGLRLPDRLFAIGKRNGVIFRAFGDGTIGLAPALCCTESEMELILSVFSNIG